MKPCVFVQNNNFTKMYSAVVENAQKMGYEVIDRSMIPDFDPDDCGVDWTQYGPVLIYGSVDFVNACTKSNHLAKYVFNDRETISMSNLERHKSIPLFNDDGQLYTVDQLNNWTPLWFQLDCRMFIRPNVAHKAFNGGVYRADEWRTLVKEQQLPDDLTCWVSSPKDVPAKEYRCWVVNGRIAGISQYMEGGKQKHRAFTSKEVIAVFYQVYPFILSLKNEFEETLPAAFTIDFAMPKDRSWDSLAVIEMNCINSSGFYGFENIGDIVAAWMDYLLEREENEATTI